MGSERLFKVLGPNGRACHGGRGTWPLPTGRRKWGEWMRVEGDLVACENGLHLCRESDLVYWLGPCIHLAETRGERLDSSNKIVVREARIGAALPTWNETTARLLACDCAAHVQSDKSDPRSLETIRVARRYARGEATYAQLYAARDAAWTTARNAAWTTARNAARDAARNAARDAVGNAARDAALAWQTKRLMRYLAGDTTLRDIRLPK